MFADTGKYNGNYRDHRDYIGSIGRWIRFGDGGLGLGV